MNQHQWGFAPRIGVAWSPASEVDGPHRRWHVLRPRRILQRLFAQRRRRVQRTVRRDPGAAVCVGRSPPPTAPPSPTPFGTTPARAARGSAAAFQALVAEHRPDRVGQVSGRQPFRAVPVRRLRHQQQASLHRELEFDVQYQPSNSWLFSAGYVGNHGVHEVLADSLQPAADRHAAESRSTARSTLTAA